MSYLILCLLAASALTGCDWLEHEKDDDTFDKVLIFTAPVADNGLWNDVSTNIKTMQGSWIPVKKSRQALILLTHGNSAGSVSKPPYIIRLYKQDNKPIMDTLKTYSVTDCFTQKDVLSDALAWVKDNYESESYGMVLSTHGTGWLPEGYYSSHPQYTLAYCGLSSPKPLSIGPERTYEDGVLTDYELSISDFRDALSIPLDYIVFDACLMACSEVAYELRDVCRYLLFSACEVIGNGFDYTTMVGDLLKNDTVDGLEAVGRHFYELYDAQSGWYRTATVSLVDNDAIDELAAALAPLVEKYSDAIAELEYIDNMSSFSSDAVNPVQGFYSSDKHWFFDLEDILVKAGMTESEQATLDAALAACVIYKANTPTYLNYPIKTFCGLTMFLPCAGDSELLEYYRNLSWNKVVALVK